MALFTVSLDFKGGTYLRQVHAQSQKAALQEWVTALQRKEVQGLGPGGLKYLANAFSEDGPTAISGLKNVWCASAIVRGQLALIHVTQTVE